MHQKANIRKTTARRDLNNFINSLSVSFGGIYLILRLNQVARQL